MLKHRHFLWSLLAGIVACCMLTGCLTSADDTSNSTTTTTTTTTTTATTTTTTSSDDENEGADAAYAPFLKEWRQVSHWWRNGAEYFSVERWRIQMTDAGLMGYYGASPYVAVEDVGDVGDSIAFEYNGKHFTRFGGGGFEAVLEKESDTVLVGHNIDDEENTFRFVLDPEDETLTVTQLDADGVLATIVYDTKMSVESGVFVDKGDLDNP